MNTNVKVDILHKTITISQKFYHASMVPYSIEFEELLRLKRKLPDYSIEVAIVRRLPNANKGNCYPTYDEMRQVAMLHGGESELQELERVIAEARCMSKCPYSIVRGWFIGRHYEDAFAA